MIALRFKLKTVNRDFQEPAKMQHQDEFAKQSSLKIVFWTFFKQFSLRNPQNATNFDQKLSIGKLLNAQKEKVS